MKRFFISAILLVFTSFAFSESRNALLVANGKYSHFGSLDTPLKEARELKISLEKLGFTVKIIENASKEKMMDSLYDFENILQRSGGIGFFHYGGHAVQVNGRNFLIPVDADIPDERRVASRSVDVDEIMASMVAETNIVILDACRNNPLPAVSGRSATRGLILSESRPKNSIIVYSAQPGKVAQDGVFTPILAKKLLEKKSFVDVLIDVRKEVRAKTGNEQSPGEYNELESQIYLAGFDYSSRNEIVEKNVTEKRKDSAVEKITTNTKKETKKSSSNRSASELFNLGWNAASNSKFEEAFAYYSEAAEQNHAPSLNNLAVLYFNGTGVRQDKAKAMELYERSAVQGHAIAVNNLALNYYNGDGVKKDINKSFYWWSKGAELGDVTCKGNLGMNYLFGFGCKADPQKAREIFMSISDDSYAQFELGVIYENGYGVPKNYSEALKWYEKSSHSGAVTKRNALKDVIDNVPYGSSKYSNFFSEIIVKGGSFSMGSRRGFQDETPVHAVAINSFAISTTEVTRDLYGAVMNVSWNGTLGKTPATGISWFDVVVFCNKLSMIDSKRPCYSLNGETNPDKWGKVPRENDNSAWNNIKCDFTADGYRLPTEAEWEYAAVEGSRNSPHQYSGSETSDSVSWNWMNSANVAQSGIWSSEKGDKCNAHEVATKFPNALGLYDMSGNVFEWCWDWYDANYYLKSPSNNPLGPSFGTLKVARGGSFWTTMEMNRVAARKYNPPSGYWINFGFRTVRTIR